MKNIIIFFLIAFTSAANAQLKKYVLFEDQHLFQDLNLYPFALRLNHIELQDNSNSRTKLHIFNFYFSCSSFRSSILDKKAFKQARANYKKMQNDVLVTMTPLTDSLDGKLIKLTKNQVTALSCLSFENLLQNSIKNLYIEFAKYDLQNSDSSTSSNIKTMEYKILLKRGNDYYAFDGPVLTECYLIHSAFYFFPNQYHYGEINVLPTATVPYFSKSAISEIFKKFPPTISNDNYPKQLVYGRVFPSHVDSTLSKDFNVVQYDTYPKRNGAINFLWKLNKISDGVAGIGTFDFSVGIGIINGSFDFYVYKNLNGEGEEQGINIGTMQYRPVKINDLSLNKFLKEYLKHEPLKIISQ